MGEAITALVVMGVSGCGKSSVGAAVAELAGARLIEGDSFHPAANIAKMSAGVPLDDTDRAGWLAELGRQMAGVIAAGERPVLTCSALKRRYREALRTAVPGLGFVFLDLTPDLAARRVAERPGHFMPASLIDSQFAALERPGDEALTFTLDASVPLAEMAASVIAWWRASGGLPTRPYPQNTTI